MSLYATLAGIAIIADIFTVVLFIYALFFQQRIKRYLNRKQIKEGWYLSATHYSLGMKDTTLGEYDVEKYFKKVEEFITGATKRPDLDILISNNVGNAIDRQIATVIEKGLDKDLLNNKLVEKVNKALNNYFKEDKKKE